MSSDSSFHSLSSDDDGNEIESVCEKLAKYGNLRFLHTNGMSITKNNASKDMCIPITDLEEIPPVMSLWQQVQQLPVVYLTEVQKFYESFSFPFEVRHYLADWIESKKWDDIDENDEIIAINYLTELVSAIERKIPEFSNEYFTIRVKLENATKDFMKIYGSDPFKLIKVVKRGLAMEQACVESHKGQNNFVDQQMNKDQERNQIFTKLRQMTQITATDVQTLQQKQESFILHYQHYLSCKKKVEELKKTQNENLASSEQKILQMEHEISNQNKDLIEKRCMLLNKHTETYEHLNKLTMEILEVDLMDWLRKQQLHGVVDEMEDLIDNIQKWCSQLAEFIWENRQQIKKTILMHKQLSADDIEYTQLNNSITDLLSQLVTRTFIVLMQPNQILKKESGRFTASVTLLVGKVLNVDKNPPTVTATLISEQEASQLNNHDINKKDPAGIILNNTGTMELISDKSMIVTFRNMQLKKVKRTDRKTTEAVTEEKFALLFNTDFRVLGEELTFYVWTVSNPVVVTVHGNQECKASATILWDNHFAEPSRVRFKVPEQVPWKRCAELLSSKFKKDIGVALKHQDLQYLATKVFGGTIDDDFSQHTITWNQFCKENMKGKNFTFWEWFHAIVKLTKEQLYDIYKDNLIAGFIGKQQAQQMLLTRHQGTFLLRFSDNQLGGITIAWLGISKNDGSPYVWNLYPYDLNSLKIRSLPQRLQDLQDLTFLYPDYPKIDIFKKYMDNETDKQDRMLAHGYVPTILKDHIKGVSNVEQSPVSDILFSPTDCINFGSAMEFEFDEFSPNVDYSADDISFNHLLDYDTKVNADNCRG